MTRSPERLAASLAGLGSRLDSDHVRSALTAIHRYNYAPRLRGHYNPARAYAVDGEAGTLVCSYPRGGRPSRPFPYWSEVWTGLEYTAAAGMALAGLQKEALDLVAAVRSRHDGTNRNPFDEPECGHHYVRSMAAWALIPALTGFGWSALDRCMEFARATRPSTWFWSTGWAYGVVVQRPRGDVVAVDLELRGGSLSLERVVLRDFGDAKVASHTLTAGDHLPLQAPRATRNATA